MLGAYVRVGVQAEGLGRSDQRQIAYEVNEGLVGELVGCVVVAERAKLVLGIFDDVFAVENVE